MSSAATMILPSIFVSRCDSQKRLLRLSYIRPKLIIYWRTP